MTHDHMSDSSPVRSLCVHVVGISVYKFMVFCASLFCTFGLVEYSTQE